MGKFNDSGIVDDPSGLIGKNVYGKNRYGKFIRQAPVRTKPFTPTQVSKQEEFKILSPTWSELEDYERIEWNKKGEEKQIARMMGNLDIKTGWNLFHSVNITMLSAGEPIIKKVPTFVNPQNFKQFRMGIEKVNRKKELILETEPGIDENTMLVIYGTKPISPGIMSPNPNEYKIIASVNCNTITLPNSTRMYLTESYEAKYGKLPMNRQKVSFWIKAVNRHCAVSTPHKTITFIYRDVAESPISKQ